MLLSQGTLQEFADVLKIFVRWAVHRIPKTLHFVDLNRTTSIFIKELKQRKQLTGMQPYPDASETFRNLCAIERASAVAIQFCEAFLR